MRHRVRLSVALPIAVVFIAGACVALAPAALLDRPVAAATGDALHLVEARGTVWRGNAIVTDASGTPRFPCAWRLSPLALLRGDVELTLDPQGRVSVSARDVALTDVHLDVPASILGAWLPRGVAAAIGGTMRIDVAALRFDGQSGDGALDARWEQARIALNGALADFGTATLHATPRGADITGTVTNAGGNLRIAGDFVLTNDSAGVSGTIAPVGEPVPEIARMLAALGTPDASGAVRFAWRGKRP